MQDLRDAKGGHSQYTIKSSLKRQYLPHSISVYFQNIILYEYVPSFLGVPLPTYQGYKAELAPGVTHAFAVAAFRFGHTLVPPAILLRDRNCRYGRAPGGHDAIRLCQTWWDGNVSTLCLVEITLGIILL